MYIFFREQATEVEDNDKFWSECLLPEYYPPDLDLLDLRDCSWQVICSRTRMYEEDIPHDNSGLIMKKIVWTVDLRDSENKLGCVEVDDNLILQDGTVNTLKVMARNLSSAGMKFPVRCHLGREHKDSRLLADEGSTATTLIDQYGVEFCDLYVANPGDVKTALTIASGKYRETNADGESGLSSEGDEDAEDSEEDSESSEEDSEEDSEEIPDEYVEEDSEETSDEEFEYD